MSGGAPLPVRVLEEFNDHFGVTIHEGYGLPRPPRRRRSTSWSTASGRAIGHPIWGVEVEIADADVDEAIVLLPVGEVGEIVIRGHNVFKGYHGRAEATAAAIVDGWFRTGDLGTKDERRLHHGSSTARRT